MNCPNCGKRPIKLRQLFGLKGVAFKEFINGYFRCQNCGTLLRQDRSSNLIGKFKSGYWLWYTVITLAMFGALWGIVYLFEQWMPNFFWPALILVVLVVVGYIVIMNEIKYRYWIIKEADKEMDQKTAPRMGVLGWIALIVFISAAFGGFIFFDRYVDISQIPEFIYTIGMVAYMLAVAGGSIAIFKYFDESESLEERPGTEAEKTLADEN